MYAEDRRFSPTSATEQTVPSPNPSLLRLVQTEQGIQCSRWLVFVVVGSCLTPSVNIMEMPFVWLLAVLPFGLLIWLVTLDHQHRGGHDFGAEDVVTWLAEKRWLGVRKRTQPAPRATGTAVRWSETVTRLAEAAAAGEDCDCALHDALLEAGHPELADCFYPARGPASSWAIQHILGKE